ncbi:MAG TPA: acyl-CoA desaturase, partial [Asticcacaulis sp.]|nr:acyl-CoA desaturase [Asticcacaulis sp.]
RVVYAPVKSLFILAAYALTAIGVICYLQLDTVLLFLAKTGAVLLLGHSVGMHRRLIHKSFACPLWLERFLVYMGVLAGLGGPFTMIRTHDFRDWAQRQTDCHPYFAHRRKPLIDAAWQMHCEVRLASPPELVIEPEVARDPFYRFIERHWITVHLPWALLFFAIGGWGWVLWGVGAQIAATATGHWLVGYIAHQPHGDAGPAHYEVRGAGVQGRNVPLTGLITMGEGWHNNHHAFPGSARLGLFPGQSDPGYRFIKALEALGLAWHIRLPQHLQERRPLWWRAVRPEPVMRADQPPCPALIWIARRCGFRTGAAH